MSGAQEKVMEVAYDVIVKRYEQQLVKALKHFLYSHKKIIQLPTDARILDEEMLETWESFSSRFSRVVDIFLTKYIRASVKANDPGFEGTLRDFANQGEKLGLLDDVHTWMSLRELRNISAHTYEDELGLFLEKLKLRSPPLLELARKLNAFI